MTTYKNIRGTHVLSVTSDPPSPVNGQMWYNSTDKVVKGFTSSPAGTWSTAANMNTARHSGIASAGANTEAALGFGGGPPPAPGAVAITESWNGSSWTEVNNLNTARYQVPGTGSTSAGLVIGGYTTTAVAITEDWNGTSFVEVGDLNIARYGSGAAGTTASALAFGGNDGTAVTSATEEWSGSSNLTKSIDTD